MLIGYSRVSTNDQSLDSQIDKLKQYGCEKIYSDIISGSKAERKQLNEMLEYIREGDTVVVYRLDRLGRSLKDLINLINIFQDKKVNFKSITENLDTSTPTGKLMFHISGAFAEFERNIIRERTKAGLESARARGKNGGRPTVMSEEKIKMAKSLYKNKDIDINTITKQLGVCRATFYKMIKF